MIFIREHLSGIAKRHPHIKFSTVEAKYNYESFEMEGTRLVVAQVGNVTNP